LLRHGSSLPRSNSSSVAPLLAAPAASCLSAGALPSSAGAAAAAAPNGVTCSGSIGRVLLSRLSLGLVLDERRLQELLAGGIKVGTCFGVQAYEVSTWLLAQGCSEAWRGSKSDSGLLQLSVCESCHCNWELTLALAIPRVVSFCCCLFVTNAAAAVVAAGR
jgi:hypothetical protein